MTGVTSQGRLADKIAIVTGGASGMGKATVLRFCSEGAHVVAADLNEASAKALLDEAAERGFGRQVRFIPADVAVEDDVAAMVADAVDGFGGLDIVFNNAGVGGAFGPVTDLHVEDWDYTFSVLCRGVFLGIKHGARAMKASGHGGAIINTASVAGLSGGAGPLAYSAAKAAVINLTRAAAVQLAADRIRVNAICPGAIVTPLLAMGRTNEELEASLVGAQPWPETGQGEHIAGAALFLASDDARFVTGEALVVDGGMTAAGPNFTGRMREQGSPLAGLVGVSRGNTGQEPIVIREPS
jgi:NAD(P)-dependent dehydrogenase (short-subunit alcohol dehydrogenase family)